MWGSVYGYVPKMAGPEVDSWCYLTRECFYMVFLHFNNFNICSGQHRVV